MVNARGDEKDCCESTRSYGWFKNSPFIWYPCANLKDLLQEMCVWVGMWEVLLGQWCSRVPSFFFYQLSLSCTIAILFLFFLSSGTSPFVLPTKGLRQQRCGAHKKKKFCSIDTSRQRVTSGSLLLSDNEWNEEPRTRRLTGVQIGASSREQRGWGNGREKKYVAGNKTETS